MKLNFNELMTLAHKKPTGINKVCVKFNYSKSSIEVLTADVVLEGILFTDVEVGFPHGTSEKTDLFKTFFSEYMKKTLNEMPSDGVLVYRNYPKEKIPVCRPMWYMATS